MDTELVARQVVRAVRGKRSQKALARRLGYRTNPVAEWEGGRRFPTAGELFRACELVGIDVAAAMGRFCPQIPWVGTGDEEVARWLSLLAGRQHDRSLSAVSEVAGVSRHIVSRVLSGRTRPRLPVFLTLVEAITFRVTELVDALVSIEAVPCLQDEHRRRLRATTLAYDLPWSGAIGPLTTLELYRALPAHDDGWFADKLGIPLQEVREAVEALLDVGELVWDGPRLAPAPHGPRERAYQDSSEGSRRLLELGAFWARTAGAGLPGARTFSSGVGWYGLSTANLRKLAELHHEFMLACLQLSAEQQPVEHMILMSAHLVGFADHGKNARTPR